MEFFLLHYPILLSLIEAVHRLQHVYLVELLAIQFQNLFPEVELEELLDYLQIPCIFPKFNLNINSSNYYKIFELIKYIFFLQKIKITIN